MRIWKLCYMTLEMLYYKNVEILAKEVGDGVTTIWTSCCEKLEMWCYKNVKIMGMVL